MDVLKVEQLQKMAELEMTPRVSAHSLSSSVRGGRMVHGTVSSTRVIGKKLAGATVTGPLSGDAAASAGEAAATTAAAGATAAPTAQSATAGGGAAVAASAAPGAGSTASAGAATATPPRARPTGGIVHTVRSAFAGLTPLLLREVPFAMITWWSMEKMRKQLFQFYLPGYLARNRGARDRLEEEQELREMEETQTAMEAYRKSVGSGSGAATPAQPWWKAFSLPSISVPSINAETGGSRDIDLAEDNVMKRDLSLHDSRDTMQETLGFGELVAVNFVMATSAAMLAALCTHPADVMYTEIVLGKKQIRKDAVAGSSASEAALDSPPSFREAGRRVYERFGFRGFLTGLIPRSMRVAPACGIIVSSYEFTKRFVKDL